MQKTLTIATFIFMLLSCNTKAPTKSYPFYLGTYTQGESKGIYQGRLNAAGTFDSLQLAAVSNNPSFLCFAYGNKVLLAVNEVDTDGSGTLASYLIDDGQLKLVDTAKSGGAHPCHVNVNAKGDVLISNYTGGSLGLVKVTDNGQLSELSDVARHAGQSRTGRQTKPHVHSAWYTNNPQEAIVIDLGLDKLFFYDIKGNRLVVKDSLAVETGSGPRHAVFHPKQSVLYVANELNSTLTVLSKPDKKSWKVLNSMSTLPDDFKGESYCADIRISPDGRFLYVSNRGHNSLAIFSINHSGEALTPIAHTSVKGVWPRNFALTADGEYLLVANQHSNNLVSFKRDKQTGLLTYLDDIKADAPVCVLFEQ